MVVGTGKIAPSCSIADRRYGPGPNGFQPDRAAPGSAALSCGGAAGLLEWWKTTRIRWAPSYLPPDWHQSRLGWGDSWALQPVPVTVIQSRHGAARGVQARAGCRVRLAAATVTGTLTAATASGGQPETGSESGAAQKCRTGHLQIPRRPFTQRTATPKLGWPVQWQRRAPRPSRALRCGPGVSAMTAWAKSRDSALVLTDFSA